ncbi:MAG: phenylalanine--tRNA ligase subunit beta, partial [Bacteroidota bacterium]
AEVPTNKADVLREVDMIEEILRIYGFNNVPIPSRVTTSIAIRDGLDASQVRNLISDHLAAQGFNEMMALSLSESRYYQDKEHLVAPVQLVYINNTSNVHLDIMRPHMVYSGLEAILRNQNRQEADLRLFEFGRTYSRDEEIFTEVNRLSIYLTGRRQSESWLAEDNLQLSYYSMKAYVTNIMNRLGISGFQQEAVDGSGVLAFGSRYFRGSRELVRFGRLQTALLKEMDIKGEVFYADFHWDNLFAAIPKKRVQFQELNKFPVMRRDLALVVDNSVKFSDIAAIAAKAAKKLLSDTNLFDVYVNDDQLGAGKKSYAVSFIFEDTSRTLKIKEVDKVMQRIIQNCEQQLGAQIRR